MFGSDAVQYKLVKMARAIATLYGDPDAIGHISHRPMWELYMDEAKVALAEFEKELPTRESAE